MKYILLALTLALALGAAGCSKYEVYERNLTYLADPMFNAEKARVTELLAQRQSELAKAEASGDPERLKKARAAYDEAQGHYRAAEGEDRRRHRSW